MPFASAMESSRREYYRSLDKLHQSIQSKATTRGTDLRLCEENHTGPCESQDARLVGIGRVHRYPLAELKCVSPKRQREMAARLGGEPGGARSGRTVMHLFFAQRFQRIDFDGAARGQVAGEHGDRGE
jgi:hypothetical protein